MSLLPTCSQNSPCVSYHRHSSYLLYIDAVHSSSQLQLSIIDDFTTTTSLPPQAPHNYTIYYTKQPSHPPPTPPEHLTHPPKMGSRLSQPRGPAGTTEASRPAGSPGPPTLTNPLPRRATPRRRTLVAPAAALTLAALLFLYARTSVQAAKRNAQAHRDADSGGEGLSLLRESRRRHGLEARVDGAPAAGGTVGELARAAKVQIWGEGEAGRKSGAVGKGDVEDERLRVLKERGRRGEKG